MQFFSSLQAILKEISPIKNCEIAVWHTFSVKFRVFRRGFLLNLSVFWAQIFRDTSNCYALSIFRVFILLAATDSDKHNYVNEAKIVNKASPRSLSLTVFGDVKTTSRTILVGGLRYTARVISECGRLK